MVTTGRRRCSNVAASPSARVRVNAPSCNGPRGIVRHRATANCAVPTLAATLAA